MKGIVELHGKQQWVRHGTTQSLPHVQNYPAFNKVYCPILALERSQYNCTISLSNKMSTSTK